MATKTISLELDAYEKLKRAKKAGESFSQVVRRARFERGAVTGNELKSYYESGGSIVPDQYLDAIEEADTSDKFPDNPWA